MLGGIEIFFGDVVQIAKRMDSWIVDVGKFYFNQLHKLAPGGSVSIKTRMSKGAIIGKSDFAEKNQARDLTLDVGVGKCDFTVHVLENFPSVALEITLAI